MKTIIWIAYAAWVLSVAAIAGAVGWYFGIAAGVVVFVILALAPLGGSANGSCSGGDDCEYFQEDDHG